ncbi:MAG: tripartite tricarboxylate transporter TctB family protein [Magnetovibrio sp.]|nr:tripartite tricarboxylate transporter TctB family protein [Magnetovibrio sp.]
MTRLNRDTYVAILLLLFCGVFIWATFDIRQPDYGVLMPSTWPRVILSALTLLCFIFLIQSIKAGPDEEVADPSREPGFVGFLKYWRNPILCFVMFFLFLLTLPILGMLIGGISFVFLLMTLLGGWQPKQLLIHAVISVCAVGAMWSLFTFGLEVMLPEGVIYNPYMN